MLQLELGDDVEERVVEQASQMGVSVNSYVRTLLLPQLPEKAELDAETLERRQRAAKELATFAKDRGIDFQLPEGMSWREYIREASGL